MCTVRPPCAKVAIFDDDFARLIRQSCMQQCFDAHLTPDKKAEVRRSVIHPFRMSHPLDNTVIAVSEIPHSCESKEVATAEVTQAEAI